VKEEQQLNLHLFPPCRYVLSSSLTNNTSPPDLMAQLRVTTASASSCSCTTSNITTSNSIFTNHTNILALHSNSNLLDKLQQLQLPVAAACTKLPMAAALPQPNHNQLFYTMMASTTSSSHAVPTAQAQQLQPLQRDQQQRKHRKLLSATVTMLSSPAPGNLYSSILCFSFT
jgi:hypothetical protein